jgi:hypothetical protein
MIRKTLLFVAVAAGTVAIASSARAQEAEPRKSWLEERVQGPRSAVELNVATGYTQGFGGVESGTGMPRVAGAGVAFEVGGGVRFNPDWLMGASLQYGELTPERGSGARTLMASAGAAYHAAPMRRLDPFIQFSTGYRLLWENMPGGPTVMSHGFQFARATVGVDLRVSRAVAVAPIVGADATVFLWQVPSNASARVIDAPTVNAFVFAGLQGRFDFVEEPVRALPTQTPPAAERQTGAR